MQKYLKQLTIAVLLSYGRVSSEANPDGHHLLERPQFLENYSFDFSNHHMPLAYDTYGASVQLLHKYKLIPDIKDRYGSIVLNKRIKSDRAIEVDVEFMFKSDESLSHGFSIFFLANEPKFPQEFDDVLGYRPDYKGLGVFLYRSEKRRQWTVIAIQNKGLASMTDTRDLDRLMTSKNSCNFDLNQNQRGGIRIRILMDYIYVWTKEANGDVTYSRCSQQQIRDPVFHHFAITSSNQREEDRLSNIDIDTVSMKNLDAKAYLDRQELEAEKIELMAQKSRVQQLEDGTYHPHDLMAHKIREHLEKENRKSLAFLDQKDSKIEMLYKHYQVIKSYQHAFDELIQKAQQYRKQEEQEALFSLKTSELQNIQATLDEIKQRTVGFNTQFEECKDEVMSTFGAQFNEYATSVDNSPGHGIDAKLAPKMKNLHSNIDSLIRKVDATKEETLQFKQEYMEELEKKKQFYDAQQKEHSQEFRNSKQKQEMGDMESSSASDGPGGRNEKLKLDEESLNDIKFGAETLRTTIKEKYLGREKGAKRGEIDVNYGTSGTFQTIIGLAMLGLLAAIYMQVNKIQKSRFF